MPRGPTTREFSNCSMMEEVEDADGTVKQVPCQHRAEARGKCSRHYIQQWRRGEMDALIKSQARTEKVERLRFYAPPAVVSAVYRMTRATGKTLSELLREIVTEYLKAHGIKM